MASCKSPPPSDWVLARGWGHVFHFPTSSYTALVGHCSQNHLQTRMPLVGPTPNNMFHIGIGRMCTWRVGGEVGVLLSFTRFEVSAQSVRTWA